MGEIEYVVIGGGGRIGSKLAELLIKKGIEVVIVEKNKDTCEALSSRLNAMILNDDITNPKALEDAGARHADVFVAVTGDDSHNIVACHMAKHIFQVPITMARVENPEMRRTAEETGIDFVFSPSQVSAFVLENSILLPGTTSVLISETLTRAVEITLERNAPADGKMIEELKLPKGCIIGAIYRKGSLVIPHGRTVLKSGDIVALIGEEEAIRKAIKLFK